jgi:bifunctional enzyme CysN/CysC
VSRGDLLVAPDARPHRAHDVDAMVVWMAAEPARRTPVCSCSRSTGCPTPRCARSTTGSTSALARRVGPPDHLNSTTSPAVELTVDRELLFDPYRGQPDHRFVHPHRPDVQRHRRRRDDHRPRSTAGTSTRRAHSGTRSREVTADERVARFGQRPVHGRPHRDDRCREVDHRAPPRTASVRPWPHAPAPRRREPAAGYQPRPGVLGRGTLRAPTPGGRDRLARQRSGPHLHRRRPGAGRFGPRAHPGPRRDDRYVEVFLDAPEPVRRARDPHGLYTAADRGEIAHLPGVTLGYERPEHPDLQVDTSQTTVEDTVDAIIELLRDRGFLPG